MEKLRVKQVSLDEAQKIVDSHALSNPIQSVAVALRRRNDGWNEFPLAWYGEDDAVVAFAMLHAKKTYGIWSEFEIQRGPLVDYHNATVITQVLIDIQQFVKSHGGISLLINPPVVISSNDGTVTEANKISDGVISAFLNTGFKQIPNQIVDQAQHYLRWFYVKDISGFDTYGDAEKSFTPITRNRIKRAKKLGVEVRRVDNTDDLARWISIVRERASVKGYNGRSQAYYNQLFDSYPSDRAYFMLAEISRENYVKNLEIEKQVLLDESKKSHLTENQLKDLSIKQKGLDDRLSEVDELFHDSNTLLLSAGLFLDSGRDFVYFIGGNDTNYLKFNGAHALQSWAINHAIENHYVRYNFYGTRGDHSGNPEQQGVYEFKAGFKGVLEEEIGYFEYSPHPRLLHSLLVIRHAVGRLLRP